jgi:hypothetical protein
VLSQFVARYLKEKKLTPAKFKAQLKTSTDPKFRAFLEGDLGIELGDMLKHGKDAGAAMHAALYELGDAKLEDAMIALGTRLNLILSNGSDPADGNAAARKHLNDSGIVTIVPTAILKPTPEQNKFAKFDKVTDYQTVNTYEIGGSQPEFLDFQFTHKPLVAVVEVCGVQPVNTPFGVPPPKPVCDPTSDKNGFVVLTRDLGQLRLPPILAFISSGVLFGLGLLGLHWRERDEAERARQQETGAPAPVPART